MKFPLHGHSPRLWLLASAASSLLAGCAVSPSTQQPSDDPEAGITLTDRAGAEPLTDPSAVEQLYLDWLVGHEARGGDRAVAMRLTPLGSVSVEPLAAEGLALLDLIEGHITVQVDGLDRREGADVWLVDNQDGGSVLPDANDVMVRVGHLSLVDGADQVALDADFDTKLLDGFRIDVVAISEVGKTPVDGGLAFGRASLFHRMYTEQRLREEQGLDPRGLIHTDFYVPSLATLDAAVSRGFYLFTQETFDGNGRTCSTCHRVDNNFTIDPGYIQKLPASDPLFVHEQVPELAELESPQMLRQLALVRGNVDGFDKPARLRAVPSINGIATSLNTSAGACARSPIPNPACGFPPNIGPIDLRGKPILFGPLANAERREGIVTLENTGWGGDGAPHDGTLHSFAVGAIAQHMTKSLNRIAGVDYRVPSEQEADDLLVFQLAIGRQKDIDTSKLAFADSKVEAGRKLFDLSPGGCKDESGVAHCACDIDIHGNPCGRDVPEVPDGAGCGNCHNQGSANTDLISLPNVANRVNLNFDIGTVARPHPVAEQIALETGEPLPQDCGFGKLSADEFESYCHYVVSWPPYSYNSLCSTGPTLPAYDCFKAPGMPALACDFACGAPGLPPCNAWGPNVKASTAVPGGMPIHGKNPWEVYSWPLGWYFAEGSWCDLAPLSLPLPIITAGMPAEAVCEQLFQPAEWSPTGGQMFCASDADCDQYDRPGSDSSCQAGQCTNVPGCKCVDNSSCRSEQFCFRQAGSPIDGYCLGLEKPKTRFDASNPEHVARAANRAMVEPTPVWSAFARVGTPGGMLPPGIPGAKGDACNPFLNGTPPGKAQCFGPQTCLPNNPYNPASGVCGEDPSFQPEVLSFCEYTETYPNNELPFGCFPGSPNPACQGCIPFDPILHAAWEDGTHTKNRVKPVGVPPPCWIDAITAPIEHNCGADNPPFTQGPGMEGYGDGTFTTTSVIESADTGPFFHNNSAATLEDAIAHYSTPEFNQAKGRFFPNFPVTMDPVSLDDDEVSAIAAYLRVLNAIDNITHAQKAIEQAWFTPRSVAGDGRIAFAESELEDAMQVLSESHLHLESRVRLLLARVRLGLAFRRPRHWNDARVRLELAGALYQIARARDAMVTFQGNSGDWEAQQWLPDIADVIWGSIDGELQSAEEAAFEAELAAQATQAHD